MISSSDRRNLETAFLCLERAVHPNTGDGEITACIAAWRRKIDVSNMSVEEVCRHLYDKPYAIGTTLLEYEIEWKAQFEAKQRRIQALVGENIDLRRDLVDAKRALEESKRQNTVLSRVFMKKPARTQPRKPEPKPAPQPPAKETLMPEPALSSTTTTPDPPQQSSPPQSAKPSKAKDDWSETDLDYLVRIHTEDYTRGNLQLAEKCSEQFGREITENAIRGQLNRLRARGRVPRYRPGHERKPKAGV